MLLIEEAFKSNYIAPLGPMVDAFEREFEQKMGIPHAAAVSSGTAAMHLALRILGVGPGDEVILSTLTFIGSVTPVVFQGATPVFIDSDYQSWCMDPCLLQREIEKCAKRGKLPKAVVPTDLYGQCADLGSILAVCKLYRVPVISDSAESLGATYRGRSAGAGARASVYSFNGNKIITTSGGGMLASEDKKMINQAKFLSQQARDYAPHYEHSTVGYNYRMSNILAAIGRGQLKVLDQRVEKKRQIFSRYQAMLGDIPGTEFMPEAPCGTSSRWLTVILITPEEFGADREAIRSALEEENIESRPVWKPMHLQPVFQVERNSEGGRRRSSKSEGKYKARIVGGGVAEDLFNRGLCLPSGTAMTNSDLDRIVSVIRRCRK